MGVWTLFILGLLWRDYFFSRGDFSFLRSLLMALYIIMPWLLFSLFIGRLVDRGRKLEKSWQPWALHVGAAISFTLFHTALLASHYWLFFPQWVDKVTFGYVFGEQFVKWFPFELAIYGGFFVHWRLSFAQAFSDSPTPELTLQSETGMVKLKPDEILWLQADNNYVVVHTLRGPERCRSTLAAMKRQLSGRQFAQTHRSAVINKRYLRKVSGNRVELSTGARVVLSRRRRSEIVRIMQRQDAT